MKLRTWCIRIGHFLTKTGLGVRAALLLMLVCCFAFVNTSYAETDTQGITIRQQNVTLEKVFQAIEKQSGYRFFYNESLLEGAGKVSLNLRDVSLEEALEACFRGQPFGYTIVEKTIIVKRKMIAVPVAVATSMNKIIAVRGKVTSNDLPVVGATITVKGTDNATSTDVEGMFTLGEVDDQSTLVVSHVSHQIREIRIKGQTFLAIDLQEKINELEESIVVAYNTTTQKRNTGSVTLIKGDQINALPNRSIDRSLQGMVPGLQITTGGGLPGGGVGSIVLRGISTGQEDRVPTVRNPLIIIDGVQINQDWIPIGGVNSNTPLIANPLSQINTSDIETISILKDAAAIALYGTRASNGVIIITTKKGKAGRVQINFRHQTDIASKVTKKIDVLNQDEYLNLLSEAYKNSNPSIWTDQAIRNDLKLKFPYQIPHDGDTVFYNTPNWFDEIFNQQGITISNDLSLSGGNDKSNYYLNIEYTSQKGVIRKTGFDRTSVRYNLMNKPASWLSLGMNSLMSYSKQNHTGIFSNFYDLTGAAYHISPLNPVKFENNEYYLNFKYGSATDPFGIQSSNPIASNEYNINRFNFFRGMSSFYAEATFLRNFKVRTNLGVEFSLTESKQKVDPRLISVSDGISSPGTGSISEYDHRRSTIVSTNTLIYNKIFSNRHNLSILLGQEAQLINFKTLGATATGLRNPSYEDIGNALNSGRINGYRYKENLISFFGQINYDFRSKYYMSLNARRDGTSKFGIRERYGSYWALGLGWVLTEERFINNNLRWLNYFKIRGSIGTSGNSTAISALTKFDILAINSFNGNPAVVPQNQPGNPDIKWEETFNTDLGVEAKFLNDRMGITVDVYKRKTYDLVNLVGIPGATGFTSILDNIGDIQNRGTEVSISATVLKGHNFKWNLLFNWSTNKNKFVRASVPFTLGGNNLANKVGENYNSFYLVRWAGVNQADGTPQWLDSAGNITSTYPSATSNRVNMGKPQPDGYGGITSTFYFKNFEFSAFFYYQYGFQVYDFPLSILLDDGYSAYANQSKDALNRWQKPGDISSNPRRILNNTDGGNRPSTRYLFDGDYIRLKSLSVAYSFSKLVLDKINVKSLRVFAQANNLGLWTKYPGLDPDDAGRAGQTFFGYPQQKTYSIGVNVNL